jgi:hypothetical protein
MHEKLIRTSREFSDTEIRAEYPKAELWQEANLARPRRNQLRAMRNWLAIELEKRRRNSHGTGVGNRKPSGAITPPAGKYDQRRPDFTFNVDHQQVLV